MLKGSFFILLTLYINQLYANETCSRIAIINYREVPVDSSNSSKGEGLRFYLEKDPRAEALLQAYQDKGKPTLFNTVVSSIGSTMVIAGLLQTDENATGISNRNTLLYGGILLAGLSYVATKTIQYNNEGLLQEAIDQYNKRNSPRIYFSPFKNNNDELGAGIGIQQEF